MHDVHHDSGAGEASGAAAWLMASILFLVVAVVLFIALFAWAPWNDDNAGGGVDQPGSEENIDIQGDIDINDGGGSPPVTSP